jgi:hypothetical protein
MTMTMTPRGNALKLGTIHPLAFSLMSMVKPKKCHLVQDNAVICTQ